MFSVVVNYLYVTCITWLWPMWKWLLRRWTGKCELLRIVYTLPDAAKTCAIESSLKHSKTRYLKRLLAPDHINIDEAVHAIMNIKSISPEVHPQFEPTLRVCLYQIRGYHQLIAEVERLRHIPYSSENADHERLLLQLWAQLRPDEPLTSRVSKQWTEIGFQGDDPMTDFRGMGILGLQNLLFFVTEYHDAASHMLLQSAHPQYGYSFAIVGINITGLTYQMLIAGHLKTHFYNVVQGQPQLEDFHKVYSYLLYHFGRFWFAEKPRDIMEFNRIKDKFQKSMVVKLNNKSTRLTCSFTTASNNELD